MRTSLPRTSRTSSWRRHTGTPRECRWVAKRWSFVAPGYLFPFLCRFHLTIMVLITLLWGRTAQLLYERAMAVFPVTHYLWAAYARYIEAHLRMPDVVNRVYRRAVRNCPWVGQLWARALRALERGGAPDADQAHLYSAALAAGLQVSNEDCVCLIKLSQS